MDVDEIRRVVEDHAQYLREQNERANHILQRAQQIRAHHEVVVEEPEDDALRYEEAMAEAADEANFCHNCGNKINADIFGMLPKFCRKCGKQVR